MATHVSATLSKRFAGFGLEADLEFGPGITALVGPSGSGKTTLIRCLAGLEAPERGSIRVGGETWLDTERGIHVPIQRRRVGFVFNDYALFPEMTVAQNALFGARSRAVAMEWLELLDVFALRDRLPRQLSAGQQQRVAIARALASEPRLLLMDEPFSSLDPHLKDRVHAEFARIIRRVPIPVVLVTHDLNEASMLGSSLVVLSQGRVLQAGRPDEVQLRPKSPEVARLVGYHNVFEAPGDAHGGLRWGDHQLVGATPGTGAPDGWCVRDDRLEVVAEDDPRPNVLPAEVQAMHLTGAGYRLRVRVAQADELDLVLPVSSQQARAMAIGEHFKLRIPPEAIHLFAPPGHACRPPRDVPYPTDGAGFPLPTPGA